VGRAEAYNRSDRPKAALEDYDRALALGHLTKNETARLRTGAGSAHLKLRNYKAAIENFNTALELRPNHINAMKWRGLAFQAIDETDSAARDYDGVLKLKPTDEWTMKRVQALRKKETEPRASPNKP
jgi:tetratricopeptide (TPR) repeat protein